MKKSILWAMACLLAVVMLNRSGALAEKKTWALSDDGMSIYYEMTTFGDDLPEELSAAMEKSPWADWQCLQGIQQIEKTREEGERPDSGAALVAVQKDGKTMLLHFINPDEEGWKCLPAAEGKALLTGRTFTFGAVMERSYPFIEMIYPMKDGGREMFELILTTYNRNIDYPPEVRGYRREEKDGSALLIGAGILRSKYFFVERLSASGERKVVAEVPFFYSNWLEALNADEYPKSEDELHSYIASHPQPYGKGYGIIGNANLREKPTTQSKKLGAYHHGTLAKMLDVKPGKPDPWYKVQVGETVGYISGIYFRLLDPELEQRFTAMTPPGVGKTNKACELKAKPSGNAKEVTALSDGTEMYVLADCGDWLHVCIPNNGLGYWMEEEGTYGYLPAEDVMEAFTPLRLRYADEK